MHGTLDSIQADAALLTEDAVSNYGARNHFSISSELKETAKRYGLEVSVVRDGVRAGRFSVRSIHGAEALDNLLPRGVELADGGDSVEFSKKELKGFLRFLRQPIAQTLTEEKRHLGHNVARFATTGLVEIPAFVDEDLQDAKSLECHEKGERKMKEDDVWAMEPEFWNPKEVIESKRDGLVSSIPGTTYDPREGFVLNINSDLMLSNGFEGNAQNALSVEFWGLVNQATAGRYHEQFVSQVAFSGKEFQQFLELCAESPKIQQLVRMSQVEEKSQAKLAAVSKLSNDLKEDPRFQIALAAKQNGVTADQSLSNIKHAITSCLTPVLDTAVMFETWKHSNFTERLMGLSDPVNDILEEYAVMKMTIDQMEKEGKQNPADLQAMVNQFRPLLSFSAELAEIIEESTGAKKKFAKQHGEEALDRLSEQMSDLQTVFSQASVNGVTAGELSSDYEEVVEALKNVFGQNGNVLTQTTVGYFEMMKEFWVSAAQSAGDNVPVFAVITGFVGYAWWTKYGVDAQLAQEASTGVANIASGTGFFSPIGDAPINVEQFREAGQAALETAIESGEVDECIVRDDCHYNKLLPSFIMDALDESVSKYLQFRHWVGKDVIASNAMTAQTLPTSLIDSAYTAAGVAVDQQPTFTDVSQTVTDVGGEVVVDANMWQDGSHAAMLAYGSSRIAMRGPRGFKQMTGLAAEFINPTARLLGGPLSLSKRIGLKTTAAGLMFVGQHDAAGKVLQKVKPPARLSERLMEEFVEMSGGDHDFVIDRSEPAPQEELDIDAATVSLGVWAYGTVKENITIGSKNIKELQLALNEFGLALKHSSKDIGVVKADHKAFLTKKLLEVEEAVEAYLQSPDRVSVQKLQSALDGGLQHIMGAELKYADSERIYDAVFPGGSEEAKARRQGVLKRTAAKKEGRVKRADYRQEKWQEAKDFNNRYQKPEKLASLQSLKYAWGAVSTPVTKARLATLSGLSYVGDAAVFAAREVVQEPVAQLPYKKAIAKGTGALSAVAIPLDMAANVNSQLVDTFSAVGAAVTSVGSTAVIAGAINLPQDLALHTGAVYFSGAALGLPWYTAVKKGSIPAYDAAREKVSSVREWAEKNSIIPTRS